MGVQLTQEMIQGAIDTQNKYGVPASVTLAQILQESGGSYAGGLSGLAYNYKNLFGIKAGGSWTGKSVSMSTGETYNGQNVTITDAFRVYDSFADSIEDHGKLLASDYYTKYTSKATTADEYAKAIHQAGYATDPNYSDTLISLMKQYNLYQYDSGKIGGVVATGGSSSSSSSGGFNIAPLLVLILVGVCLVFGAMFMAGAFVGTGGKSS